MGNYPPKPQRQEIESENTGVFRDMLNTHVMRAFGTNTHTEDFLNGKITFLRLVGDETQKGVEKFAEAAMTACGYLYPGEEGYQTAREGIVSSLSSDLLAKKWPEIWNALYSFKKK